MSKVKCVFGALVITICLVGMAKADSCNQCKNAVLTPQGCLVCQTDLLLGGCTCTAEGPCAQTSEQCGSCGGFTTCQTPGDCCNIQGPVKGAALRQAAPAPTSWLMNMDLTTIADTLAKESNPLKVTQLLKTRGAYWAEHSENCGHLHGLMIPPGSPKGTTLKYEVITTVKFMEVIVHLDADHEENFSIRRNGDWRVINGDHQVAVTGNALKVSPNLNIQDVSPSLNPRAIN